MKKKIFLGSPSFKLSSGSFDNVKFKKENLKFVKFIKLGSYFFTFDQMSPHVNFFATVMTMILIIFLFQRFRIRDRKPGEES